eukprot:366462-Chlamydomonas_euryale.AAC.27
MVDLAQHWMHTLRHTHTCTCCASTHPQAARTSGSRYRSKSEDQAAHAGKVGACTLRDRLENTRVIRALCELTTVVTPHVQHVSHFFAGKKSFSLEAVEQHGGGDVDTVFMGMPEGERWAWANVLGCQSERWAWANVLGCQSEGRQKVGVGKCSGLSIGKVGVGKCSGLSIGKVGVGKCSGLSIGKVGVGKCSGLSIGRELIQRRNARMQVDPVWPAVGQVDGTTQPSCDVVGTNDGALCVKNAVLRDDPCAGVRAAHDALPGNETWSKGSCLLMLQ